MSKRTLSISAMVLAVLLAVAVFLQLGKRPKTAEQFPLAPLTFLRESESSVPLKETGAFLLPASSNQSAKIRVTADGSFFLLVPEGQRLFRLNNEGKTLWESDLRKVCDCGFCNDLAAVTNHAAVLDMRHNRICQLDSTGRFSRHLPLSGSSISVSFDMSAQAVAVNSLMGDSFLRIYSLADSSRPYVSLPPPAGFELPEENLVRVARIGERWVLAHRYLPIIEVLDARGRREVIGALQGRALAVRGRTPVYQDCAAGNESTLFCLLNGGAERPAALQRIQVPSMQTINYPLSELFTSIASDGSALFLFSPGRNAIWVAAIP